MVFRIVTLKKFLSHSKKFQYARNVRQRSAATVFNGDSQDGREQ